MTRLQASFSALVLAQGAHSIEEYLGRLYESFPPARFVSGLVSDNLQRGFIIANVVLVAFGAWCVLVPVRRRWNSAHTLIVVWLGIELVNGIGHPLWSARQGGYTPGVGTAPLLLVLALWVWRELKRESLRGPGLNATPGGAGE